MNKSYEVNIRETLEMKVSIQAASREEAERRHVVNRKLAQIINLSAGSAAVR